MASPSHEDHSDLDSLFGDDETHDEYGNEIQKPQRSIIRFPRAAVLSQNVGTIAHSSVPSSTEHPHSSGPMSSVSIPSTRELISRTSLPPAQGKRNASPGPTQPNKKRRVGFEDPRLVNKSKLSLANLGLSVVSGQSLTSAKLKSVASLLAPLAVASRNAPRGPKGKSNTVPSVSAQAPITSGTGTVMDPVVITDEPMSSQSASTSPSAASRRLTRSQQARLLFNALPNDPSDVLSQTLRTILKHPTTVPHSRNNAPRDTAVYLANGRLTGTPFLRLLRYLAGPTRRTDPTLGLTLLKKLVEAMRATEDMSSKAASAGQSSTASTPMPTTPRTPSFATHDNSGTLCSSGQPLDSNLFSQLDLAPTTGLDGFSFPTIAEFDSTDSTDIAIDPELLALSQDHGHLQITPHSFHNLGFDLAELLGVLPTSLPECTISTALASDPGSSLIDSSASWDALANSIPLESFLGTWLPNNQSCFTGGSQPTTASAQNTEPPPSVVRDVIAQSSVRLDAPGSEQALKQQNPSSGNIRIPPRAEALALLEQARARKKELEAKISFARRQLWGCKIEAGVERNLLDRLRKER